MAFTTQNIADLGITFDDAGFHSNAKLYIPDPAGPHPLGSGPRPVFIGTHSPHYTGSADLSTQNKAMTTFCNAGWIGLAFSVRSLEPFNGQTTTGKWPQQSEDFHKVVQWVRTQLAIDFPIVGAVLSFVGGAGPSGAASHAMTCTIEGTVGDDRLDFCVACSPATDFSNREGNTSSGFIFKTAEYADLADTDFVNLKARSPIALITADDKNVMHINGSREQMPAHQLLDVADEFAITTNYLAIYHDTAPLDDKHGYAYWEAIAPQALTFAAARLAEFNGSEPPEPPDPTGRVKVTALITGLAPGLPLTLNVAAHDTLTNLDGPVSTFDFISDRADTGGVGKGAPVGVYALVDAIEGVITGDIATRAWHGFSYVDGATLPTTWKALNPTTRGSYDWSQTDAFLAALFDNDKQGGIAISMGIKNPLWIYGGSHSVNAIFVNGPNSGTVPIPWDPNYLGVIKRFIIDMSVKYDTHPNLSYIAVGGMGQLLDTILVQNPADYTNLNNLAVAAGYASAIDGWTKTAVGILDMWQKAFRTTTCYLALNLPVPAVNGGLTGIDEFVRSSIDHYKSRFGIMSLQLDGLTGADSNLSINSIIRDANRTARAYRYLWPSTDPNCDPSQSVELYDAETGLINAADAGIAIGAQMEEFYEADILTVTNNYPAHFADFQTDLTNNAV